MKKILITIGIFAAIATSVYAAGNWGSFTNHGSPATTSDAIVTSDDSTATKTAQIQFSADATEVLSGTGTWVSPIFTEATHTGEVTGDVGLTVADNIIDEANLKLDAAATNDYVLTADSTKSGGMKWSLNSSANIVDEVYSSGDWAADTANGASQKSIYDYLNQFDTNDDGDLTDESWWSTELANYQGINAYLTDISGISFVQGDVMYFDGTDLVRLAPGISGQFLETKGAAANPEWGDPPGGGDITAVGDVESGAAFTELGGGNVLYFEGTTPNLYEIALTGANPVADVIVTIPASTTTLVGHDTSDTLTNKILTSADINTPDIDGGTIDGTAITATNAALTTPDIDNGTIDGTAITATNSALTTPDINGGTVDVITSLTVANNVDIGAYELRALTFESDVTTGTAPFTIASTTVVGNLNASFLEGHATSYFQIDLTDAASLYASLSDVTAFLEDLSDDSTPSLGGHLAVSTYEIQSTDDVVIQLGGITSANVFEIQDSTSAAVFTVDATGAISQASSVDPTSHFNQTTAQDFWIGAYDTTADRFELRTNATAGSNVIWYVDLTGNMSIASGQAYQINGTQIDIGDLGAAGAWTPTGAINLDSATITLNSDALTVDDGSNYTTISNDSADDTIDELFAAVNTWAAGVGAGSFAALSDTTIAALATGHLAIYDGTDSWDNKAITGAVLITGAGVTSIDEDQVTAAMMADGDHGDFTYATNLATLDAGVVDTAELASDAVTYAEATGSMKSLTPVTDAAADFVAAFTGANLYGGTFVANVAGTIQLPAIGTGGMNFTIITLGAVAVVVEPNASDNLLLDGTQLDDADSATNLSTAGDIIVFQYYSAAGWVATSNGWTDED